MAMFWFEMFTCVSSEFSSVLLKISHQLPLNAASFGCANFHPSVSLKFAGVSSLYAGGVDTVGVLYFGALSQPLKSNKQMNVTTNIL